MRYSKKSHGFDSQLERRIGKTFGSHNKKKVSYTLDHSYNTDFIVYVKKPNGVRKAFLIEAKGIFRGNDRAKYLAIQKQYEEIAKQLKCDLVELVFVFQDPTVKVGRTKQSHGEWAEKNGFKFGGEWDVPAMLEKLKGVGEVSYG
jgi:hypothetical protein